MSDIVKIAPAGSPAASARKTPTRQAQLRKLLTRKSGATITQIQETFGWQSHTARAAISALRKEGCAIDRAASDRGSVYRIVSDVEGA